LYSRKGLFDVTFILPWGEEDYAFRLLTNAADLHRSSCQELDLTKNKKAQKFQAMENTRLHMLPKHGPYLKQMNGG
jgi:hypothetical protein